MPDYLEVVERLAGHGGIHHERDKKESGAACLHETDAECHGYNRDCESGRGRGVDAPSLINTITGMSNGIFDMQLSEIVQLFSE